ncbi:MAG: site-specific integrase, partial [Candidatus Parvarchaeota archaeon]|nr:site-specific integrase [Candidatus Parvarchaeum tengchongense]
KLGFKSRREHFENSTESAGSKRDKQADSYKPKNAKSGFDYAQFLNLVKEQSAELNFHQLKELKGTVNHVFSKKYRGNGPPKYGSINKGFTELELQRFLRSIKSEKFALLFKYQAYMGLRIGEVCKLHISNIDFGKRELTLKSEKSGKMDVLLIPLDLFKETVEFAAKNAAQIKAANGYIFYKENNNNHNELQHVEQNYVRKVFREIIKECGLDTTYGESDESLYHRKERTLHRLTTHSLRHYAITKFAKSTNGNVVLASRFARHANPSTTMRYISKDNEELYREIDIAFMNKINPLKELSRSFR